MARKQAPAERRGVIRCAVYTRKSTEEGLEQEFNSLDAQREACAAYILSQRHEGWIPVQKSYDDGGFSGGNMERPGLKRLMADVEAGLVDVIVVYKVDRLTRALSDFAKIVEVLDAKVASFVSVTQAFNTTTSMGRLTLNVLLSFAQFEREVTGERIRDKVAASKAKGMWMGGPVPLGYRLDSRKLLVEPSEAEVVRHIFRRYVALGNGRELIEELEADGYRTKVRSYKDGSTRGGGLFTRGMLFALLGNRTYLGQVEHKGSVYDGEHDAIIEQALWDAVHARIEDNRVARKRGDNVENPSLLVGLLYDPAGRRMSPSHASKPGKRYRYYVTPPDELREGDPPAWRMPAQEIEDAVTRRLASFLADAKAVADAVDVEPRQIPAIIDLAAGAARKVMTSHGRRTIVPDLLERVSLTESSVVLDIDLAGLHRLLRIDGDASAPAIALTLPAVRVRHGKDVKLVLTDSSEVEAVEPDPALVALLGEARSTRDTVLATPGRTIKDLALELGQCRHRLTKLVRLSWLAPDIAQSIVDGRHPPRLTPRRLLDAKLPADWAEQRAILGVG